MLNSDFALMVAKTNRVGNIKGSDILINAGQINRYYSESSQIYLEEANPEIQMSLNNTLDIGNLSFLAQVNHGQAVETEHPVWGRQGYNRFWSVGYKLNKSIKLTVGANNIFEMFYPPI
ncbi:hypothetical protein FQR65_LT16070 [Abscondita terminalis]|nr:hypothetical protein FQR65_LT16070 [Abscondita terminalis]